MAFKVTIIGEDTLDDYAKINFEKMLVDATNLFVEQFKKLHNVTVTTATAETDTHEVVSFLPAENIADKAATKGVKDK